MSGKKIVILGATGMVGGHALEYSLAQPDVAEVVVIGRRSTGVEHTKLTEIQHSNYEDYEAVRSVLSGVDAALFCIGAYTGTVPDDEFRKITVDYTVNFAKVLVEESPQAAFCLLSGQGADQTEKSRVSFARYKGMAENALLKLGFARVHILRPGYIYPVVPRKEPNFMYRFSRWLWPVLRAISPNLGVHSDKLGFAVAQAGLTGTPEHSSPVLENRDIRVFSENLTLS